MHLLPSVAIQPNLELKTRPKQLLGSLPLVIALPGQRSLSEGQRRDQFLAEWEEISSQFRKRRGRNIGLRNAIKCDGNIRGRVEIIESRSKSLKISKWLYFNGFLSQNNSRFVCSSKAVVLSNCFRMRSFLDWRLSKPHNRKFIGAKRLRWKF